MTDQQKQVRSIEEVQKAEAYAARLVSEANAAREKMLKDAREKAAGVVEDALAEAKSKRETALKRFSEGIGARRKKELDRSLRSSRSIESRRLSSARRKELIDRLIKRMFGE